MQGVFIELRSVVGGVLGKGTDWRSVSIRALPVAAAVAASAGGLGIKKRFDPPDADLLSKRASFECRTVEPSTSEAVERSLEATGVDLDALRRAAQRLRGPLERDLMATERSLAGAEACQRQRLYGDLVERWRAAGYPAEPLVRPKPRHVNAGIDLVTQEDEGYGRDVGCEVPLCLLRSNQEARGPAGLRTLPPEDWSSAAESLQEHGAVLLRGLLPARHLQAVRSSLGVQVSALDRARSSTDEAVSDVREYSAAALQEADPDLEPVVSSPGRRHFYLRGRALEEVVRDIQAGALPLVWEHLMRVGGASRRPYVSEVQLLVADPCAEDQFWHVDNIAPGITLFMPLTPMLEDLGLTLFLPGTHHLFEQDRPFRSLRRFAGSFLASEGVASGTMGPGDALIYDSRAIHRTAANRRYDRCCVALLFRYDFERPPGIGRLGTQLISWTGNVLAAVQGIYAALPRGPAAPATQPSPTAAVGGSGVGAGV